MDLEQYRLKTNLTGGGTSDAYRVPYTIQSGDTMQSVASKLGRNTNQIFWPSDNWDAPLQAGQTVYASYDPTEKGQIPTNLLDLSAAPKAAITPVIGKDAFANNATPASSNQSAQKPVPALGTTAYTNYLLGGNYFDETSGAQIKPFIPSTTLPSVNMPANSPTSGNISDASAGTSGLSKYYTDLMSSLDTQRQSVADQQAQNKTWLENFLSTAPTAADTRTQAEATTGVNSAQFFADQQSKIAEIQSLTEQYNGVVAARDSQIAQSYDKMGSTNFIDNQVAQINRNSAPVLSEMSANINSKAATLQALQGNFDRAQTYINQAVTDATSDTKFKLDSFSMFYQMNQDSLSRLDQQYQDAMNKAYDMAKTQYTADLDLKNTLADLQIKNPQVSINLNGTLDAAVTAIRSNPQADKGDIFGSADTGYYERYYNASTNSYQTRSLTGGSSSTSAGNNPFIDVMQESINQGATAEQAAREAASVSESNGIPVDQKTLANWTTLAQTLKAPAANTQASAPTTQIEKDIQYYKNNGLSNSQIQTSLKSKGYGQGDISNSTVGNLGNTINSLLDSTSSFLNNLFGG